MVKFYIATGLENIKIHHQVRDRLISKGHLLTYDWTVHGDVRKEGVTRLKEVCKNDLRGVKEADLVIVILPGGKGTHTELGYSIGVNKKVFLYSKQAELFTITNTCCFYFHENVQIFTSLGSLYSAIESVCLEV